MLARPAVPLVCENMFRGQNQQKLVVMATSLEGSKTNLRFMICTNPENLAKIGSIDRFGGF